MIRSKVVLFLLLMVASVSTTLAGVLLAPDPFLTNVNGATQPDLTGYNTAGFDTTTGLGTLTYTFNPGSNNTVTITFTATTQRYFRLNITANTGWPAGQVSTFEVWNI